MNTFLSAPTRMKTIKVHASALTDVGQKRPVNEDAVFKFTERTGDGENVGLYIVCDGMGGYEAGDVASQLVVRTIVSALGQLLTYDDDVAQITRPFSAEALKEWLQTAILKANTSMRDLIKTRSIRRMGSTVTAVLIYGQQAYIAHLGDSRAYLWRAGVLTQITSDHTFANELVKANAISAKEGHTHAMRHILTRAVRGKDRLDPIDVFERTLLPGDRLLLCTDGLWMAYPDAADLGDRIGAAANPGALCWQLVAEANRCDGSDNISTVAIFIS